MAWATPRAGPLTEGEVAGAKKWGTSWLLLKHVGGIAALLEASTRWVRTLFLLS